MRIVISQRRVPATAHSEQRDALDCDWYAWLESIAAGTLLFPLPNLGNSQQVTRWLDAIQPDWIILSGGNDIGSCIARDRTEDALVSWAAKANKPLLGVCRGMQWLHTCSGGQLVALDHHVGIEHRVQTNNESLLTNSWHRFGIEQCVSPWEPVAHAEDGSIEAMRHSALPWLGLMWHPERPGGDSAWLRQHLNDLGIGPVKPPLS